MSVPLGGFGFNVTANVTPAQQAIQRLIAQSRQSAQQLQQAFAAVQIRPDTRAAEQSFQRLQRARQQAAGSVTINVRAEAGAAEQQLGRIAQSAQRVRQNANISLNLRANADQAQAAIASVERSLRQARSGERVTIALRADAAQAEGTLGRLRGQIRAAEQRGARIVVNVDTRGAEASVNALRGRLGQFGGGFIQGITPGLAAGAAAGVGAVVAQGVLQAAAATLATIREAQQARFALQRSFGQQAPQFTQFAAQLGPQIGASNAEVERASVIMGTLQRSYGLTARQAQELVRISANLGAVHGKDLVDAATRVQAALRGEAESAEALGLTLNSDAVRAMANMTAEQRKNYETLGQVEKAQIIYNELLRQSTYAQGAAAERALMGAGASDKLAASFKNLGAAIGAGFEPVMVSSNGVIQVAIDKITKLIEKNRELARLQPGAFHGGTDQPLIPGGARTIADTRAVDQGPHEGPSAAERRRNELMTRYGGLVKTAAAALQDLEGIADALALAHARIAEQIAIENAAYERLLVPLQQQLDLIEAASAARRAPLEQRAAALDVQGIELEQRQRAAQAPAPIRAQVAVRTAELETQREILGIQNRRAEIAEELAAVQERAADRVREAELRASQQALDGLREQIRARQEATQLALEGLREQISAQQQQRRDAIDGLQEEIRARREAVDLVREAAQEAARAAQEAFADQERIADRGHRGVMEQYRDQAEALREQLDVRRQQSEAERALAAFDRAEREHDRQERLADARRAVRQATSLRGQQDARRSLARAEHDVEADRKREALQERIAREREAAEKRREQIQDRIAEIERTARDADRAYQREREVQRDAFEAKQRQQQQADREAEKAERAQRRAEDAQIRAEEKAAREADRAEQAQLRSAEQAARAQERVDAAAIRQAEQQLAAQRLQFEQEREAREIAREQATAERRAKELAIEQQLLGLQELLLKSQNAAALAAAAGEQVLLEDAKKRVELELQLEEARKRVLQLPILQQAQDLQRAHEAALRALRLQEASLQVQEAHLGRLRAQWALVKTLAEQAAAGSERAVEALRRLAPQFGIQINAIQQSAGVGGWNAGVTFVNAWNRAMDHLRWPSGSFNVTVTGGGTATSAGGSNEPWRQQTTGFGPGLTPGYGGWTQSQQPQRRAIGGPFSPGWVLAGEAGPELIRFRQAGSVLPAGLTARALSGAGASGASVAGGGGTRIEQHVHVTVNADGITDPNRVADLVADRVAAKSIEMMVDALDHSATNHPTPVDKLLSGAS